MRSSNSNSSTEKRRRHPLEVPAASKGDEDGDEDRKKSILLTLPRWDVEKPKSTSSKSSSSNHQIASYSGTRPPLTPPLLLLQLPPGWKARDLKGSRFVAAKSSSSSSSSSSTRQQQHQQQQQEEKNTHHHHHRPASLVVERKRTSFTLQRVETSNALVLVPPPPPPPTADNDNNSNNSNNDTDSESNKKRLKVDPQQQHKQHEQHRPLLQVVSARLLNHGSGAWFLEGRKQSLELGRLHQALQQHVYNPLLETTGHDEKVNSTTTTMCTAGRTVESLANEFQCSKHEIQQGLYQLESAFILPTPTAKGGAPESSLTSTSTPTPRYYGFLSEEATLVVREAILAALMEEDAFSDYCTTGVNLKQLVSQVVDRLQETRGPMLLQEDASCLARHGIFNLVSNDKNDDDDDNLDNANDDEIRLSVEKVAVWVARRLFQTQTAPWEENALLQKWQAQLPGVGDAYTVRLDMLRGIAVLVLAGEAPKSTDVTSLDNEQEKGTQEKDVHQQQQQQQQQGRYWTFLPRDKLPTNDPAAYMAALFDVKEQWETNELQPYTDYLADYTTVSRADILLQYTKVESVNGRDVYVKR